MIFLTMRSSALLLKAFLVVVSAGIILSGCALTKPARDVEHKVCLVHAPKGCD